jgi:small-conductance mechanosensitive channel
MIQGLVNTGLFDNLNSSFNTTVHHLPNALVTALAGFVIIRLISWLAQWIIGFIRMPKGLKGIIISLMDTILTAFLIIQTLQALGLTNLALVFSAAIAAVGIALGSGSSTLVQDILAGIYLAGDKDFNVGDIVKVGDSGVVGEIMSMDMRRTRVLDADGNVHSLPNSVIERKEFVLITKKRDRKAK